MPSQAPHDNASSDDLEAGMDFQPSNELERILSRCVLNGARAALLRALARSTVCVPASTEQPYPLSQTDAGGVGLPCVTDDAGRHALIYTSYRQMVVARQLGADAPWFEIPVASLFSRWPVEVDVWLNAGGELGVPLDRVDVATVADIAAGLEVDEAYEIGPDDEFTDFPGPSIPDQVDCAVVLALFAVPEVLEVLRVFRRLEEPSGRTWRILLVLVDRDLGQVPLAQTVAEAVNEASDECCEVHVANVHDDEVYDAVAHLLRIGVPLWRRQGFPMPDTVASVAEAADASSETAAADPEVAGPDRTYTDLAQPPAADPDPAGADPAGADPADPDPADLDPTDPGRAIADSASSGPADPDLAGAAPQPHGPDPDQADPNGADAADPDPGLPTAWEVAPGTDVPTPRTGEPASAEPGCGAPEASELDRMGREDSDDPAEGGPSDQVRR